MNHAETMPALTNEELSEVSGEIEKLNGAILALADRMRGRDAVEQRWLQIGVTDVEKGLMSIVRAIVTEPLKVALAQLDT